MAQYLSQQLVYNMVTMQHVETSNHCQSRYCTCSDVLYCYGRPM